MHSTWGGGCELVCGTINAAAARPAAVARSGVVWRLWPPAREGQRREEKRDGLPTRGERYRFGRRRRRRAGTREIDVVAAALTTRRARESGGDVRQRSIGNRWELPPLRPPSLSVRPPKYLSTDDAVSPPQCCLAAALVLRQRQGGQSGLFKGALTRSTQDRRRITPRSRSTLPTNTHTGNGVGVRPRRADETQ